MRRTILFLVVLFAFLAGDGARADYIFFDRILKARLLFEVAPGDLERLNVDLRLVSLTDAEIRWTVNGVNGVEATILDSAGHPLPEVDRPNVDLIASPELFTLSGYSRLEWCLSAYDPIPPLNPEKSYVVAIGPDVWLIPKTVAASCSVRLKLRGWIGWNKPATNVPCSSGKTLLLDLPPQKIVLSPPPAD